MTLTDVVNNPGILQFHPPLDIPASPSSCGSLYSPDSNISSSTLRFANTRGKKITITSGSDPHIEERKL